MIGSQRTGARRRVAPSSRYRADLCRPGDSRRHRQVAADNAVKTPAAQLIGITGHSDYHRSRALLDRVQQLGQPIARGAGGQRLFGRPIAVRVLHEHRHALRPAPGDLGEQSLVGVCGSNDCQ